MKSYREYCLTLALLPSLLLHGCAYSLKPEEPNSNHKFNKLALEKEEQELFGKEQFEYGLSLSGGGIRSALFSIGVLKGLSDQGLLNDVEVISTVSGGSYANYWLMSTAHHRQPEDKQNRMDNIFSDNKGFNTEACEFSVRGNMMPWYYGVARLLPSFTKMNDFYRCKLERTFGFNDQENGRMNGNYAYQDGKGIDECIATDSSSAPISAYKQSVADKKIPYFISNATVKLPTPKTGIYDGAYEFTPILHGNERYGYDSWEKDQGQTLSNITAISGAAYDPLLDQTIELHHGTEKIEFTLSDGGHSENLGLLALIRRGTKNIISVDAEYDPEFAYQGYFILKDRLKEWGLDLRNEVLDRYSLKSKTCTYSGTGLPMDWCERFADGPPFNGIYNAQVFNGEILISNIRFVKLSVASEVIPDLRETCTKIGSYTREHSKCYLGEDRTPSILGSQYIDLIDSKTHKHDWMKCDKVAPNYDFTSQAIEQVLVNLKEHSDYPHRTTLDQSYRQSEAYGYMGLGYMYGSKATWPNSAE